MQDTSNSDAYVATMNTWRGILARCSPLGKYTARGIGVCPQWRNSFEAFVNDVGLRPSTRHSIDRLDNSKGYEPGNVRWATPEEQKANRSNVLWVEFEGRTVRLGELAERFGLTSHTIAGRLGRGWSVEEAVGIVGRSKGRSSNVVPSERQGEVLEFIKGHLDRHGYAPTIREICAAFEVTSTNAVSDILKALKRKGLVDWLPGQARTLRVVRVVGGEESKAAG